MSAPLDHVPGPQSREASGTSQECPSGQGRGGHREPGERCPGKGQGTACREGGGGPSSAVSMGPATPGLPLATPRDLSTGHRSTQAELVRPRPEARAQAGAAAEGPSGRPALRSRALPAGGRGVVCLGSRAWPCGEHRPLQKGPSREPGRTPWEGGAGSCVNVFGFPAAPGLEPAPRQAGSRFLWQGRGSGMSGNLARGRPVGGLQAES